MFQKKSFFFSFSCWQKENVWIDRFSTSNWPEIETEKNCMKDLEMCVCACVRVCVRVCVREREKIWKKEWGRTRERDSKKVEGKRNRENMRKMKLKLERTMKRNMTEWDWYRERHKEKQKNICVREIWSSRKKERGRKTDRQQEKLYARKIERIIFERPR
jgi:hypothetical protein